MSTEFVALAQIESYLKDIIRNVVREMEEEKKHVDDWERRDVGEHPGL